MSLAYWVVNAFVTGSAFSGNPASVMVTDHALPAELMQQIAAQNNLAETAFVVPKADGYDLRWFTPGVEVKLCGHATLASAFVLRLIGDRGPYFFDTLSGRLSAEAQAERIVLDFPGTLPSAASEPEGLAEALGVKPVAVLRAQYWIAVLESAAAIRELKPDIAAIGRLPGGMLIVTAPGGEDGADVTSRFFAPGVGIDEDPVTGSMHTQIVPYWAGVLGRNELVCRQASARGGVL